MNKLTALGIAFVLLLIALPLISAGTTGENPVLWWAGLLLIVLGALIPPVTRYLFPDED